MNLTTATLISLAMLTFSSLNIAAPIPNDCNDFLKESETNISLALQIKKIQPEQSSAIDFGVKSQKDEMTKLKNLIAKAPINQNDKIAAICREGIPEINEANEILRQILENSQNH